MPDLLDPPPKTTPRASRRHPARFRAAADPVAEQAPHRTARPVGQRVVLEGVDWATYVRLRDLPGNEHHRFTFDGPNGGLLEIEMPTGDVHELVKTHLGSLITTYAKARRIRTRPAGEFTQSRQDLDRGLKADECYYVSGFEALKGKPAIDLEAGDPAPDLAVEVDVTSPGVSKLPIYAALGVSEVWVWSDETITVRRRQDDGSYEVVADSVELPGFPVAAAADLLRRRAELAEFEMVEAFEKRLSPG